MKSYQVAEGGGWRLAEREERPIGASEVRVRVRACSLNYRDLLVCTGKYGGKLPVGLVPGSDASGEVVEIGSSVARWKVGDPVIGCFFDRWSDGAMTPEKSKTARGGAIEGVLAETFVSHEEGLVRKPDSMSFEEAASLPCAAVTAWNSLFHAARLVAGRTVLLQGTGGVSIFALQYAKAAGLRTIVTSGSPAKLERAKRLGADFGIDSNERPDWDRAVYEITGGEGVDAVLEVGGAGTLGRSLKAARYGGHISVIGVLSGAAAELSIGHVQAKNLVMQGIFVGSRRMFEEMLHVPIRPVVDRTFGFDEASAALETMKSGRHFGKIVVSV